MWRWLTAALVAAVLLMVFAGQAKNRLETSVVAPTAVAAATAGAPAPAAAVVAATLEAPSWRGTQIDGEIHLDAQGRVLPDLALRRLFDYLLTARGELSLPQIRERLAAAGRARPLDAAQQAQLASWFQRYLDYLDALPQVRLQGTDAESLRRTADARRALRRGVLGVEMSEGFFAAEEARERYEVELAAIRQNPALTPSARSAALASLRQQAPVDAQLADQASLQMAALDAAAEQLRESGAGTEAIRALREREVGHEAATRLAALDAERAQWQQRVAAFRSARDRLQADPAFAPEDRQRQINELIERDFSEGEALRLRAELQMP